jgi:sugar phosphate isomerase/epimerase
MIRIACSTGIRSTKSLEEACQTIHELGFTCVDPLVMEQWPIKPSCLVENARQKAKHVKAVLDEYALQCVALNLGFLANVNTCSEQAHQTNLQVVRGACVLARALGTSIITVGSGTAENNPQNVARLARRLADVVSVAAEGGMTIALETHAGAVSVYPEVARELLQRCPGLKITYDPSHFIAEEVPIEETLDLLQHAAHVHLRNARVGSFQETMEKGLLDMPWMVDQIVASGYQGAVSIEYIEDCGAIQEGYETRDQVLALKQILLEKGLAL